MLRHRTHRLTTALFVVLSLLFSQLAMASYSCPAEAQASAMAGMAASGMHCDGMDKAQPALCHEHSTSAPQSFEAVKLPAASLPMVVVPSARSTEACSPPGKTSFIEPPSCADCAGLHRL
jgi:hypothetical protein